MNRWVLATLAVLAAAGPARAQLVFKNPKKTRTAALDQTAVKVVFRFTNAGKEAITIESTRSSCNCLTVALEKNTYAPGEDGVITAVMTFGKKRGFLRKHVYVFTDEPASQRTYKLTVDAVVPELVEMTPDYLRWSLTDKLTAKTAEVKIVYKKPIKIVKLIGTNADWQAELTTVREGRHYRVTVTPPADATTTTRTVLSLITDYPDDDPLRFRLTARVARKPRKPAPGQ